MPGITSSRQDVSVLIVGAGATGLVIAHGLKKANIPFRIFEREASATEYRPREWGMGLYWSLQHVKSLLPPHLVARLHEAYVNPYREPDTEDSYRAFDARNGNVIMDMPIKETTVRMSRRKLRALCVQGIDVEYGMTISALSFDDDKEGVTASFENGSEAHGNIIIGTDGARSAVRNILLGPEKASVKQIETLSASAITSYKDPALVRQICDLHPLFHVALHPDVFSFISTQDVPDPNDLTTWRFQIFTGWHPSPTDYILDEADRLRLLKSKVECLAEPFRSARLQIPDGTPVHFDAISYWIPISWDSHGGRATLAGDAAHPMPPFRGQGLNHAMLDARNFVDAVIRIMNAEVGQEEAIEAYADEIVQRGAAETKLSREQGILVHDWERVLEAPAFKYSTNRLLLKLAAKHLPLRSRASNRFSKGSPGATTSQGPRYISSTPAFINFATIFLPCQFRTQRMTHEPHNFPSSPFHILPYLTDPNIHENPTLVLNFSSPQSFTPTPLSHKNPRQNILMFLKRYRHRHEKPTLLIAENQYVPPAFDVPGIRALESLLFFFFYHFVQVPFGRR